MDTNISPIIDGLDHRGEKIGFLMINCLRS